MSRRTRVPWVRTRIVHLPGVASAVVLLTLVTGFLATALPLQLDRYQDRALATEMTGAGLTGRSIRISDAGNTLQSDEAWRFAAPGALTQWQDLLRGALRAPLTVDRDTEAAGLHTAVVGSPLPLNGLALSGPGVTAGAQPPRIDLVWQPDPHHEVRLVQGRMPADTAPARGPDASDGSPGPLSGPVEIAVSDGTAARFGLRLGGLYRLGPAAQARLVGVYHVDRPQDSYWNTAGYLVAPATLSIAPPHRDSIDYPYADALTSRGGALVMNQLGPTEADWWYPLRAGSLKAYQLDAARQELASVTNGELATWINQQEHAGLTATTGLDQLLASHAAERQALAPLTTVGVAGTAGVGAVVLLMLLGLAAEHRREELRLLRARGASLPSLWARLFAESALYAGVGVGLGAGAALLLLPTGRHRAALAAAALVWLTAALAHPVRLLAGHRRVQPRGRAEDVLSARPSRRRTVAELTVLAATLAVVLILNGSGADASGGVDPLVTLAPLLLGLSGAILLVRLYPLPVRLLSLPSRRRDGAIAFLGLARAGRGSASAALLPLLAMLLALTVGAFGGSVLSGVQQARGTGALSVVGADARVSTDSTELDPSLVRAVGRVPGVRSVEPVFAQRDLALGETSRFDLIAVHPDSYVALSRRVGRGGFDASLLRWDGHGPLPAVASPAVAAFFGDAVQSIDSDYGPLQVQVVATIGATPAQGTNDFLVLPAAPLLAAEQAQSGIVNGPRVLLLSGPVDGGALRAAVARAPGASAVDTAVLTEQRARLADSPLQAGATGIYLASVLATGLLCLLAVLLSLLEASPERSRLLARLRTMGLTTRQGYALILTESLPPVLLAAVAGTLLGLLTVPVLGSAVDLGALSGTASLSGVGISRGLRVEALPLLGPGVLLLVLAAAVVAAEAALIGRRQIGAQLRVGDAT